MFKRQGVMRNISRAITTTITKSPIDSSGRVSGYSGLPPDPNTVLEIEFSLEGGHGSFFTSEYNLVNGSTTLGDTLSFTPTELLLATTTNVNSERSGGVNPQVHAWLNSFDTSPSLYSNDVTYKFYILEDTYYDLGQIDDQLPLTGTYEIAPDGLPGSTVLLLRVIDNTL